MVYVFGRTPVRVFFLPSFAEQLLVQVFAVAEGVSRLCPHAKILA
jgi:hypothetical protein